MEKRIKTRQTQKTVRYCNLYLPNAIVLKFKITRICTLYRPSGLTNNIGTSWTKSVPKHGYGFNNHCDTYWSTHTENLDSNQYWRWYVVSWVAKYCISQICKYLFADLILCKLIYIYLWANKFHHENCPRPNMKLMIESHLDVASIPNTYI